MAHRARSALLGLAALCLLLPTPGAAQTFTRGQWTQGTANSLASALWTATGTEHFLNGAALPAGQTFQVAAGGSSNPNTLFAYAGGGAYDSTRDRWVFCCSTDHMAYGTPEVDELDLVTGIWNPEGRPVDPPVGLMQPVSVPWPPGAFAGNAASPTYLIDQGQQYAHVITPSNASGLWAYPPPRQQYGAFVFMPDVQKFFLFGGFAGWGASGASAVIFEYMPTGKAFQLMDSEVGVGQAGDTQVAATWDADQHRVLFLNGSTVRAYYPQRAPGTRVVTLLDDLFTSQQRGHVFYDATRHRAVVLPISGLGANAGRYYAFDGAGQSVGGVQTFTVTGSALPSGLGPGVFHDPVADQYVYWKGGGTLILINPETFVATEQTFPGDLPPMLDFGDPTSSVYHRWFYSAVRDAYVLAAPTATSPGLFVLAPVRAALPPPAKFALGQTVTPTTLLRVRATPNGPILGTQPKGQMATVLAGPVTAGAFTWWQLDYATGVDGWSAEPFLVAATPPPVADFSFTVPSGKTYQINGGPIVTVP